MLRTLLIIVFLGLANGASTQVTLKTRLGKITGLVSNVNGVRVSKFLGIPYAKPPVENLRFAKPQAFGEFKELNATTYGNACIQLFDKLIGDEDCLTLNVFTPADISSGSKKPVMVWIHGGGFELGNTSSYPSEILSGLGDVVVVTVQYRLGVFGFLSTGNSILPGNLGLWDQRLALLWVKENINEYGGKSSSITLFGASAGGCSVAYQLFSPHNDASLFQRAILQSPWSIPEVLNRDPLQLTSIFTGAVNCPINEELVSCLQSKSATELLVNYNKLPSLLKSFPIADGDFLPRSIGYVGAKFTENPKRKFEKTEIGNFADFDVFGGWNDQEGLLYMLALQIANNMADLNGGVSDKVLMDAMKFLVQNNKNGEVIIKTAKNYYFNDPQPKISEKRPIEDQRIEMFAAMTGDVTVKVPMIQWLQIHSSVSNRPCYAYEYRVRRSDPTTSFLTEGPDWLRVGASHGDELASVFGLPFYKDLIPPTNSPADTFIRSIKYTEKEKAVSRKVISIWTNFAKNGYPGREFDKFRYPVSQKFTRISYDGLDKYSYPLNNVLRLWSSLYTASL